MDAPPEAAKEERKSRAAQPSGAPRLRRKRGKSRIARTLKVTLELGPRGASKDAAPFCRPGG